MDVAIGVFASLLLVISMIFLASRFNAGSKSVNSIEEFKMAVESYNVVARRMYDAINRLRYDMNRIDKTKALISQDLAMINNCAYEFDSYKNYMLSKRREAYNSLEKLRIAQNLTGGANDLGAIPYHTRCIKIQKIDATIIHVDYDGYLMNMASYFIQTSQ